MTPPAPDKSPQFPGHADPTGHAKRPRGADGAAGADSGARGADSGARGARGADSGAGGADGDTRARAAAAPGRPEEKRPAAPSAKPSARTEAGVRRRGRPPRAEAGDTRDRILAAARAEFSERGYEKTSVRGIAKAAGVDSALVHHYFGTKEQVFEAAVEVAFGPAQNLPGTIAEGPLDGLGERLTRFFFGIWENPASRTPMLAIVRSAVNNETAAAVFRRLVVSHLLRRLAAQLDLPDDELRAELAAAQLVGSAMLRYVIKVEPLASADLEQIIARLAPVVQHHLTVP